MKNPENKNTGVNDNEGQTDQNAGPARRANPITPANQKKKTDESKAGKTPSKSDDTGSRSTSGDKASR